MTDLNDDPTSAPLRDLPEVRLMGDIGRVISRGAGITAIVVFAGLLILRFRARG